MRPSATRKPILHHLIAWTDLEKALLRELCLIYITGYVPKKAQKVQKLGAERNHGFKRLLQKQSTPRDRQKLVFNWGAETTHISNVVKTPDVRIDVHRDLENPGMAIAYLHVNKNAKDPGAKEFLRKGNTDSAPHKIANKVLATIRFSQVGFNETTLQALLREANKYTHTVVKLPACDGTAEGSSSQGAASSAGSEEWQYLKEEGLSYRTVNGHTDFRVNPPVKIDSDRIWSSAYKRYFIKKTDGSVEWP